jgi:ketosteroid isomerase-like protein
MSYNTYLVTRFIGSLGDGDISSMRELLHQDVSLDFPGVRPTRGKAQTILLLRQILFNFKHLKFEITDLIEEGEKICALWENKGERKDGTAFRNRGATILHVKDGAILLISDYFKHDASHSTV